MRQYLKQGPRAGLQRAQGLGRQAMTLGLETLDLAQARFEQAGSRLLRPRPLRKRARP